MNALDTADVPVIQRDAGQVALLLGIVSACSEWITGLAERADPAADVDLADRVRALAHRLAVDAKAIVVEISDN